MDKKKPTKTNKEKKPSKDFNLRDYIQQAVESVPAPAKAGCTCGCQAKKAACAKCEKIKLQAKALGLMLPEASHETEDRLKALIIADAEKHGVTNVHQMLFVAFKIHHHD